MLYICFCLVGYINRMRGYHSQRDKLPGWEDGVINSYVYAPQNEKLQMREYRSAMKLFWAREFPVSWRDLNHDLFGHVDHEPNQQEAKQIDASVRLGKPNTDASVVATQQSKPITASPQLVKPSADEPATVEPQPQLSSKPESHHIAGLKCDKHGGPSEEIAAEMIYWEDIPKDAQYVSPFACDEKSPKYLTFEPDFAGWNNVRMAMETATVLAQATGRILVLPPEQTIASLGDDSKQANNQFTFKDFFHFDSIVAEHPAVKIITMDEFFKREALAGGLRNKVTGQVELPNFNVSSWNGNVLQSKEQWEWLRKVASIPIWVYRNCVVGIASEPGREGAQRLLAYQASIPPPGQPWVGDFGGNITAVDAPPMERLREILDERRYICIYDDNFQNQKVIHFTGNNDYDGRLLIHFYAFLFFENHHQDLWMKRFVRDHLRYTDEIQCAAARVVQAVRQKAIENGDPNGIYDSFHIRRNDFGYLFNEYLVSAETIYENTKDILVPNSTIFIATDERNSTYFDPLRKYYNLLFLDDFRHMFEGLNRNYLGMLDQRVASRGRTFVGTFGSTFTGRCDGWENAIGCGVFVLTTTSCFGLCRV